jgi:hypothetical protein
VAGLVPCDPLGVALEPVGDQVRMQGSPVRPGEHQVVGVGELDDRALVGLASPMLTQCLEGGRVEGEGAPAAGRLGVRLVHLVVDGHPRQARRQPSSGEVDVAPPTPYGQAHLRFERMTASCCFLLDLTIDCCPASGGSRERDPSAASIPVAARSIR